MSVHTSLFSESDPIPHNPYPLGADLIVVAPARQIYWQGATGIADDYGPYNVSCFQ